MASHDETELVIADEMLAWLLPKSVLEEEDEEEACDQVQVKLAPSPSPVVYQNHRNHQHLKRPHSISPPPTAEGERLQQGNLWLKSGQARPRSVTNNQAAFGGPGMQAVFLDSGKPRTGGTGVFLPRLAGTQFPPSNKPVCPPVLLPARVVHALNLNVREIGQKQHKQPRQEYGGKKSKGGAGGGKKNNISGQTGGAGHWCAAPGIFLPKEWTY